MSRVNIIIFLPVFIVGLALGLILSNKLFKDRNLVFEYNWQCAQHLDQQNKLVAEIAQYPENKGKEVTTPKIFYSAKLNTCASAFSILDPSEDGSNFFYINNLLKNNQILYEGGKKNETSYNVSFAKIAEQKYLNQIRELEAQ